jgi:DNA-binding response OmpR family regulator
MDGAHLAERLRELDPRLPIIHLSGSHSGRGSRIMPADVPTILKPFDIWDLVAEAETLISQREA